MRSKYKLTLTALLLVILTTSLSADDRSNARSIGMGNASMVSSFGIDAYGINPANYYHYDIKLDTVSLKSKKQKSPKHSFQFSILSVGGGYGSDSSMDFYNRYLRYLSINRETFANLFTDIGAVLSFRDTILPGIRADVNYDFELKWLSANYVNPKIGAINFTISDKVGLNTEVLSKDEYLPLSFLLNPYPNRSYDLTNVELHQSEATAWWIRKYTIGYARQFDFKGLLRNFTIGFSAGLVHGFGNVITYNSDLYVNTYGISSTPSGTHVDSVTGKQNFRTLAALTDFFRDYGDGAKSHFTFFPKPAGTGYSFDFGISFQVGENLRLAASITELGKIKWDYNTIINTDTNSFVYRDFILSSSNETYNRFVNDLGGFDTRDTTGTYKTDMPTKFRAGIMYKLSDKLLMEFNWVKGNNNLPSNTSKHKFSLGAEYFPLKFLPIRAGLSIGGPEEYNIAFGTGLKHRNFAMDIATNSINHIITNKRISITFSSKLIF